ncbi:DUF3563 family protein [Jiella sp. M17.18]|uniref:DUF3563 family protein n=1 Tax=Jiella sp. M17.18 TaxID=3234247 RepID=UPI0034DED8E0
MKFTDIIRSAVSGTSEQERVRRYLDRSVSMADLERRQREVDAGRFRTERFPY